MSPSTLFWTLVTVLAYTTALRLYQRSGHHLLCLPVLSGTALVLGAMTLMGVGYPLYEEATRVLSWLTGPAIIALAVPLYRQAALLRRLALPLLGALLAGCLASVLGTLLLAQVLGSPLALALSLAPKAATMPIAMQAAERAGGVPAVAALAVVTTGVLGTLFAGPVLRLVRLDDPTTRSFALGLVAHAIGTARVLQTHPGSVAFAALAMGLNGVSTALVIALLARWL
ncbi:LrgB family protein [Hydrogenophaga laconesensis]|uniref:Effector of murein hydrolase n=1 Tax=Hydrogenophaga laconesensis TaxID=1805971 RepID=A0ABU1V4P0_9BURK|nr:LrgB family protein [Hydrogenophaga laconesensis]MDR7092433.1 putative effector of murein hydrolase [Hydrogenophaga laconesensis]